MACNSFPGKPSYDERWMSSTDVSNFNQLYSRNCAGCHGEQGRLGAARSLNDSLYLSLVGKIRLMEIISRGVAGTSMPAFSLESGGSLTPKQVQLLVDGMLSRWARPNEYKDVQFPPYSAEGNGSNPGDSSRGAGVYQTYCSSCHGENGNGGQKAGSIVDPNYLALVSDQGLRTTVIVGRSDLGKPDWRSDLAGRPMSDQEISDVVAWLMAHRISPDDVSRQGGKP
jgi:cytochrome c oxidase cbb3-type subunit 3/ubiquinol-cytochrome c reductase cytochrome c subunit